MRVTPLNITTIQVLSITLATLPPMKKNNSNTASTIMQIDPQEGPFQLHTLLSDLPPNLSFSACEGYENHLYLGTTKGDLLHYFEIEPNNYILISETKFSPSTDSKITKIVLLPLIERALVLNNEGQLILFLLPEFAPVPNTSPIQNVTDLTIFHYSKRSNIYRITIATKNALQLWKVSTTQGIIQSSKNLIQFKNCSHILQHEEILIMARSNNYEIINLKKLNANVLPLFHVFEPTPASPTLTPVMCSINSKEFLVCSGGNDPNDNAMALIVNHKGDISQGTIVLDKYPTEIAVQYPYILTNYDGSKVQVNKLLNINDDSNLPIQTISSSSESDLRIARLTATFHNDEIMDPKDKELIVEKLKLVPMLNKDIELTLQREKSYVEENLQQVSSLVCYGHQGIHVLFKKPIILQMHNKFNEEEISILENYLSEMEDKYRATMTKYEDIECKYLTLMELLLILLHCDTIDEIVIKKWSTKSGTTDIRILLYILNMEIYGNIWTFHGLEPLINNLKELKLIHKCNKGIPWLLKLLKKNLKSTNNDFSNISKTIDINFLQFYLKDDTLNFDINNFETENFPEIIDILKKQDDASKYSPILLQIYQRKQMFMEYMDLLKKDSKLDKLFQYIETNINQLPKDYVHGPQLFDDLALILNDKQDDTTKDQINQMFKILNSMDIDPHELISRVQDNIPVKVMIIEQLGVKDSHDKKFIIEYYLTKLEETIQQNNLWTQLNSFLNEYKQDLKYDKVNFISFINVKLQYNENFENFLIYFNHIKLIITNSIEQDNDKTFISGLFNEISKFDNNNILTFLLLPSPATTNQTILTNEQILTILLNCNDFMTIEQYLTKENLISVMKHYIQMHKKIYSISLVTNLLTRNINFLLNDSDQFLNILRELPQEYPLTNLFEILFPIVNRLDTKTQNLALQKALLKAELANTKEMINNLQIE